MIAEDVVFAEDVIKDRVERKKKELEKKLRIPKVFFSVLFAMLFIVLSKTKMFPILGTDFNFSFSVMFGPVLGALLGVKLGIATVVLSQLVGIVIGMYKVDTVLSLMMFLPIIVASAYFARVFKGDRWMTIIPLASIVLFLLHPIGREVWFYSLFWLIPVIIISLKKQIDRYLKKPFVQAYAYSLGTAFVEIGRAHV